MCELLWGKKTNQSSIQNAHNKRVIEEDGWYCFRNAVAMMLLIFCLHPSISFAANPAKISAVKSDNITFNIPQQRADTALTQFAEQANLTLVFPFEDVKEKTAKRLVGDYPIAQAAQLLLENTGLTPTFSNQLVLNIEIEAKGKRNMKTQINQRKHLLATFIAVFGAGAGSSGVMAQGGNDAATAQRQLDEIIVTAQKREQSLQDVPISMQVLSGDFLEKANIANFNDMQFLVPGLVIDNTTHTSNNFSLRGLPNAASFLGLEPVVDTYFNGAPITQQVALSSIFDVENVEVLRGPQGALQGRPAPGGVILINTRKPDINQDSTLSGRIKSSISDDGDYIFEGGVTAVIQPEKLAIRLAGFTDDDDGRADYVNDSGEDAHRENNIGRLSIAWQPREDISALLISQFNKREADGVTFFGLAGFGSNGFHDPYNDPRTFFEFERFSRENNQHSLAVEKDFANHKLISITSYGDTHMQWDADFDQQGILDNPLIIFTDEHTERFTQEIRFESTGGGSWEYMFGSYYLSSKNSLNFHFQSSMTDRLTLSEQEQIGLFTFHRFQLSERLNLQAGLRWQNYKDFRSSTGLENESNAPTGSLQISYDLSDGVMGYLSAQRSYRPGGAVISSASTTFVDQGVLTINRFLYPEETSNSIEFGIKGQFYDNRLQANINLYHQTFDGLIGGVSRVPVDGNLDGIYTHRTNNDNVASFPTSLDAVSRGVEFDFKAILTDNWSFSGTVSFNEVVYSGVAEVPCGTFNDEGENVFPIGEPLSSCAIRDGSKVDGVPSWASSLTSEYIARNVSSEIDPYVRVVYNFRDGRPTNVNTTIGDLGASNTVHLYTGLTSKDDVWSVSLWVENLFNTKKLLSVDSSGSYTTSYVLTTFIPERRMGLTASYNF